MKDINNKIDYRPSISYEEDFYSEKDLSKEESFSVDKDDYNPIPDISDKIDSIDNIINGLPDSIKDVINNVFQPVKDIFEEELKDKEYDEIPDDDPEFIPSSGNETEPEEPGDNEEDEEEDDIEDDFEPEDEDFDNFVPKMHIVVDKDITQTDIVNKEYVKHLTDLIDFYIDKLDNIVCDYWMHIVPILKGLSKDKQVFVLSDITDTYSNSIEADKKHLLDFAIRNQIHRQTKASLASKVFSLDETLINFRNFKLSYELRLRHSKVNKKDDIKRSSDDSNRILTACNYIYDSKYNTSYKTLVKYLNSSTEMVDQLLSLSVHESTSKQYLK